MKSYDFNLIYNTLCRFAILAVITTTVVPYLTYTIGKKVGELNGALKHFKGDITCQYTLDNEVYCFTKKELK